MHELLSRDLTGFDVRDVPDTAGLQEQKKLSLGTSESWWMDVLHREYVYKSKIGMENHFGQWHETMTTEVLFASYTEFAKARNERHAMTREALGAFMIRMGAKPTRPSNGVMGEHMADVTDVYGNVTRKAELIKQSRPTGHQARHTRRGPRDVHDCYQTSR